VQENQALGPYEASCILGVHYTRVAKMAAKGEISARMIRASRGTKRIRVYSFASCQQNWQAYLDGLQLGGRVGQKRTKAAERVDMLRVLGNVDPQIDFYDAISIYEAAEILGVWHSFVARLAESEKIVGRKLINKRQDQARSWIISRRSCAGWYGKKAPGSTVTNSPRCARQVWLGWWQHPTARRMPCEFAFTCG
jgi:hypothetical protein